MSEGAVLEELILKLSADISGLKAGIAAGTAATEHGAKEMSHHFEHIKESMGELKKMAFELAAVIGITIGVEAFKEFVIGGFEATDQMAKLSDRLGMNIEALYGLKVACADTGVSFDTLTTSITKMEQSIGKAARGGYDAQKGFRELGLSAAELKNIKPEEAFGKIADALNNVKSQAERTRLEMEIFGRSGPQLANLLRKGSEGMEEATEEAKKLGIAFNRVDAAKVETAVDTVELLQAAFKSIGSTIAVALAPYVVAVGESFLRAAEKTGGFKEQIKTAVDIAVLGMGSIGDALQVVKIGFDFARVAVASLGAGIYTVADLGTRAFVGLGQIMGNFKNLVVAASNNVDASFELAWAGVKLGFGQVVEYLSGKLQTLMRIFSTAARAYDDDVADKIDAAIGRIATSTGTMTADASKAFTTAKAHAIDVSAGMKDALEHIWDTDVASNSWVQSLDSTLQVAIGYVGSATEQLEADLAAPWDHTVIGLWVEEAKAGLEEVAKAKAAAAPGNIDPDDTKSEYENQMAERLATLKEFLTAEEAAEADKYQLEMDQAKEAFEGSQLSEQQQSLIMEALAKDHEQRLTDIHARAIVDRKGQFTKEAQDRVSLTGNMMGQLASLATSNNSKLVAIGKAARYAETILNTASAAMANYNQGAQQGGPYLGAAYAAIAIAAGAAQLASISSVSMGGGSLAGGGVASVPSVATQENGAGVQNAQRAAQTINLSLSDEDTFVSASAVRKLIGRINEQARDGVPVGGITQ